MCVAPCTKIKGEKSIRLPTNNKTIPNFTISQLIFTGRKMHSVCLSFLFIGKL